MNSKSKWIVWVKGRFAKDFHRTGLFLMDIAIVALCLSMAFAVWFMVYSFIMERDEGYSKASLQLAMEAEHYPHLLQMSDANREKEIGIRDSEYGAYYAVADYFEAVANYYMYQEAGDAVRAEKWRERMEDAENRTGVLGEEKKKIRNWLGITE